MSAFPQTRWSMVSAVRGQDAAAAAQALDDLCRIYRPAVLAFAQQALRDEHEAEDLTQDFFADFLRRERVHHADRGAGRFRTHLLAHFKFVLLDHLKSRRAARRGGGLEPASLDEASERATAVPCPEDAVFDANWAMAIVREAVRLLEAEEARRPGPVPFADLKGALPGLQSLGVPSYAALASRHGIAEGTLRVRVARLRDRFMELLNSVLADTVGSAGDLESERQALLGGLLKSL